MRRVGMRVAYGVARLWWWIRRPVTQGVRVMLVQEGQVMLVKHTYQDHWYFPGGGVKRNESVESAARREAAEEVGATVDALSLVGVFANFYEHKSDHVICFISQDFSLAPRPHSLEIEEARFFPLDALPANASPGTVRRVDEFRRGTLSSTGKW